MFSFSRVFGFSGLSVCFSGRRRTGTHVTSFAGDEIRGGYPMRLEPDVAGGETKGSCCDVALHLQVSEPFGTEVKTTCGQIANRDLLQACCAL